MDVASNVHSLFAYFTNKALGEFPAPPLLTRIDFRYRRGVAVLTRHADYGCDLVGSF